MYKITLLNDNTWNMINSFFYSSDVLEWLKNELSIYVDLPLRGSEIAFQHGEKTYRIENIKY